MGFPCLRHLFSPKHRSRSVGAAPPSGVLPVPNDASSAERESSWGRDPQPGSSVPMSPNPRTGWFSRLRSSSRHRPRSAPPSTVTAPSQLPPSSLGLGAGSLPTSQTANDALASQAQQQQEKTPKPPSETEYSRPPGAQGSIIVSDDGPAASASLTQQHPANSHPSSSTTEQQSSPRKHAWLKTMLNGFTLTLEVTEKAGAAFPPLQAVAGSLLAIAKAVEKVSSNADEIRALQAYIDRIDEVISPVIELPPEKWPAPIIRRLANLRSDLKTIERVIEPLSSAKLHDRFLNAQDQAGDIGRLMQSLGSRVQAFTMAGTLSTELGIYRLEESMRENRQHTDQQFDGIHTHIDAGVDRVIDAVENQRHETPSSKCLLYYTVDLHHSCSSDSCSRARVISNPLGPVQ
ncbi:hypothetical protein FKP32DRAFT_176712 [Trametes sanguinea]|nr:hypothetical protein FKP32DRAFT_176712 [Trametes sanguinea]